MGCANKLFGGNLGKSEPPVDVMLRLDKIHDTIGLISLFGRMYLLGCLGTKMRRDSVPETSSVFVHVGRSRAGRFQAGRGSYPPFDLLGGEHIKFFLLSNPAVQTKQIIMFKCRPNQCSVWHNDLLRQHIIFSRPVRYFDESVLFSS